MKWALGVAVLAVLVSLLAGQAGRSDVPSYIYTEAARYEAGAWNQGGERFPDGARLILRTPEGRRNLAPGFFASADAAVSPDARRVLFAGRPTRQDHWQLWQVDVAGGEPLRVAAGADQCIRPLWLPDGRLVYTRMLAASSQIEAVSSDGKVDVLTHAPGWYLTDDVLRDGRILFETAGEIYTVYPDGTGVESLRCDHGPRRAGARQVASGDVVFSVGGALARFTTALAVQEKLPVAGAEIIGPVAEVAADRWLVAARPRGGAAYTLQQIGPGARTLVALESPRGLNAVEPVAVAPRVVPREFPSALVATRTTGNLLCLDARESKSPLPGAVHSVRVYTREASGEARELGRTDVAHDGSFYVEVPADRPIRMELLDAAGARLRGEERWFWMRPSEQRICVGCHAGPERAPENKVPEILNQMLKPVKMLGGQGQSQ